MKNSFIASLNDEKPPYFDQKNSTADRFSLIAHPGWLYCPLPHYWLCEFRARNFLQHFHVILMGLIQFHAAITSVFRTDNSRDKIQIWLALRGFGGVFIGSNYSCGAVSSSVSMRSKNMERRLCIYSIC